ncbi:nitroreductase [Paenibacillus sp. KS-LC4]|uniref:nitroreductase family protein n=1 Tax=Paenibacillus sp. KS-LC4 TaxID=2979727 RepID=UPI0030CAB9C9
MQELIKDRRTIRKFNTKPLSQETILELMNVAVWAPNHKLREPWRFICAADTESKARLSEHIVASLSELKRYKLMPSKIKQMYKDKIQQIPAILFIVVKEEKSKVKRDEDFAAACALIQNLQLCAWEQGIGMVWSIDEILCGSAPFVSALGVRSDERIAGMLYLGYYDQKPAPGNRTSADKKMTWL